MEAWWDKTFRYRLPVNLYDPLMQGRTAEPVRLDLVFDLIKPHASSICVVDSEGEVVLSQVARASMQSERIEACSLYFIANIQDIHAKYYVYFSADAREELRIDDGIRQLSPVLVDGVRRLDTGCYTLELCRGTAEGHGGSKWGVRYFEHNDQGINLIHGSMNAFGGVYGPFFTPENGLVNPPAHLVINIDPVVEGPVVCQYRLHGVIPNGLSQELQDKRLEMWWTFFYKSPWFIRTYFLDDYEAQIDGRPCRNRITVGDEIESGKNNLLLSTYKQYGGTAYRAGDLYAEILLERINELSKENPEALANAKQRLGIDPDENPSQWHWDNYWRLFSVMEDALPRDVLERETEAIWRRANEIVWSDEEHNMMKYTQDFIDVNREPQQTVFSLDAQKTCEFSPKTGYAFVRYVNNKIGRMQIVQRYDSGWVNWGTNGENEYPELPSGSTIWSAYGRFKDWEAEVDKMETPLATSVGPVERFYEL